AVHDSDAAGRAREAGSGVVLGDAVFGVLWDADRPTHDAIRSRVRSWREFAVIHDGEVVRFGAPILHGISRGALHEALASRAPEVGVEVRSASPLAAGALRKLAAEVDLLVGADGPSSAVRSAWRAEFGPS